MLYYSIFVLGYGSWDIIMSGRVINVYESLFATGFFVGITKDSPLVKDSKDFNPYYLVGLSDGEATFTISIAKDNRERKTERRLNERENYSVHPSFAISLNIKDKDLILGLQSYFGVGRVKQDIRNNAITYYVK
jgi:hypothetical protein